MGSYKPAHVGIYSLGTLEGRPCAVWRHNGRRSRFRLGPANLSQAEAEAALHTFARQRTRMVDASGEGTIQSLFDAYIEDKLLDRNPVENQRQMWKALGPVFAHLTPADITKKVCTDYSKRRVRMGRKLGTVWSEMVILRTVLNWSAENNLIAKAPKVTIPPKPEPRDIFLSRDDLDKLLNASDHPHLTLYIILAISTAGRMGAILDLTWRRVDFDGGMINLHNPDRERTAKGRAIVPMNGSARAALMEAKRGALTDYVIEFNGSRVRNVKRALAAAAKRAGVICSPHVLRHTAGRFMAEAGVPMEEIASFMGHSTPALTYRVYARFSPGYLRKAGAALEIGLRKVGS